MPCPYHVHNAEAAHFALNYMVDHRIKLVCLLLDIFSPLLESSGYYESGRELVADVYAILG
jgi:hypothetical protein